MAREIKLNLYNGVLIMPIPIPNTDETETEYMRRCMANDYMLNEFEDNGQRFAVCMNTYEEFKDGTESESILNRSVEKNKTPTPPT